MSFTNVEAHNHNQKIGSQVSIRPFVPEEAPNMGLEAYNMVVFEGVYHEESIACLERNGIMRYVTGLNEFAPDIKDLPKEEQKAKINEIKVIVSQLEKELANNVIEVDDKEFWNKVILLKPNNKQLWDSIVIRVSNKPVFLDPKKDPYDLIKLKAIEAGGFSLIASSLSVARANGNKFKFYLDKYEETASIRNESKKLRNKALASLQKMYEGNINRLRYVAKVTDGNSTQYRKSTPNDILYENMDSFINGEGYEKNKKKAAQAFLSVCDLDMEVLKLKAMVKDASFYRIISPKADGQIYHVSSNSPMGKNPSDVLEFLRNVMNEEILVDITKSVEKYWDK